jgi:hypothetical protein
MTTIQVRDPVEEMLLQVEGSNPEAKLVGLILRDVESRLRSCLDRLYVFEKKYGMSFEEFEDAWKSDRIENRHGHEVEADFMEWESLADEHGVLLRQLRDARGRLSA